MCPPLEIENVILFYFFLKVGEVMNSFYKIFNIVRLLLLPLLINLDLAVSIKIDFFPLMVTKKKEIFCASFVSSPGVIGSLVIHQSLGSQDFCCPRKSLDCSPCFSSPSWDDKVTLLLLWLLQLHDVIFLLFCEIGNKIYIHFKYVYLLKKDIRLSLYMINYPLHHYNHWQISILIDVLSPFLHLI